jgi:hypothetical protein
VSVLTLAMQTDVLNDPVFDPTPFSPLTILLGVLGCVGLLLAAGLVLSWVRSAREDPGDRAFRLLAARMKLSRRARSLVRKLATDSGVAPVGLLVSPRALRTQLAECRGRAAEEVAGKALRR